MMLLASGPAMAQPCVLGLLSEKRTQCRATHVGWLPSLEDLGPNLSPLAIQPCDFVGIDLVLVFVLPGVPDEGGEGAD